ncbi:MAG: hypothetical protein Q8R44_19900 [Novosphingobium sp.]|nr:hypothetical protein [Novosphingobium sp.]
MFINNELVDSSHGATIDVEVLSSGKIIAQVVAASVIDLSGWSPRYFKPQIMPGIMKDNAARVLGLA